MPEVIEKRTRNSKTHSLGGNKFAWDGTIGSIHYEDNGWQDIDNEFLAVAPPWDWEMLKAGYHIRVKEDFTAGQILEFEKQGEAVQFQPMALEWTNDLDQIQQISMPQNVTPVITNPIVDLLPVVGVPSHQGTIKWPNAYGQGIDFLWRCTSSRLEKRLEISSLADLPLPQQYILDGGNPALRLNLIFDPPNKNDVDIVVDGQVWNRQSDIQTFKMIEFVKDGKVLWGFMPLRYWGSGNDFETNNGQSVATLEKRGNKLYISIRVPYSRLQSAVFPVFIDTDIVPQPAQVGASADDRTSNDNDTWELAHHPWPAVAIANTEGNQYRKHGGFRFTGLGIPQGSIIGTAYASFFITTLDEASLDIYCEDQQSPPNFADNGLVLIQDRARTSVGAEWVATGIGTGAFKNSPSLTSPIQEVVTAYAVDNLVLLCIGKISGVEIELRAYSWDHDSSEAAKLHIEYEAGAPEPTAQGVGGGSISSVGTLGRNIFITTGDGDITPTGTLSSVLKFFSSVGSGAITAIGTLSTDLIALIEQVVGSGSITAVGSLGRKILLSIGSGSITPTGALTTLRTIFSSVGSGAVAIVGSLGRLIKLTVGSFTGWVTPTGHDDPGSSWDNEANAYDENVGTFAESTLSADTWSDYLILTISSLLCSKIRFYGISKHDVSPPGPVEINIEMDLWNGSWTNVVDRNAIGAAAFVDVNVSPILDNVTQVRMRFRPSKNLHIEVKEFDFWSVGTVLMSGTLSTVKTFLQTVGGGAVAIAGALGRVIKLAIGSGSITPVGTLARLLVVAVGSGAVAMAGTLGRAIKIGVGSGAVGIAGALVRVFISNLRNLTGDLIGRGLSGIIRGRDLSGTPGGRDLSDTPGHRDLSGDQDGRDLE